MGFDILIFYYQLIHYKNSPQKFTNCIEDCKQLSIFKVKLEKL